VLSLLLLLLSLPSQPLPLLEPLLLLQQPLLLGSSPPVLAAAHPTAAASPAVVAKEKGNDNASLSWEVEEDSDNDIVQYYQCKSLKSRILKMLMKVLLCCE